MRLLIDTEECDSPDEETEYLVMLDLDEEWSKKVVGYIEKFKDDRRRNPMLREHAYTYDGPEIKLVQKGPWLDNLYDEENEVVVAEEIGQHGFYALADDDYVPREFTYDAECEFFSVTSLGVWLAAYTDDFMEHTHFATVDIDESMFRGDYDAQNDPERN